MKKFISILAVSILSFSAPALAAPDACKDQINIKVNGLVCDFCARALEKLFGKREEVSRIKVDLDNALVRVFMKEGNTMDDETLTEMITDSGYNVTEIRKGCS